MQRYLSPAGLERLQPDMERERLRKPEEHSRSCRSHLAAGYPHVQQILSIYITGSRHTHTDTHTHRQTHTHTSDIRESVLLK